MTAVTDLPVIKFETICTALRNTKLPSTDLVVGIGSGGVTLAAIAAYELNTSLEIVWLNYRDPNNRPIHVAPQLYQPFSVPPKTNRVLLVDDVVVSGKTMNAAKKLLTGTEVTTLALKGIADIILFPNINSCVQWPWSPIKLKKTT
ncbi:MAG: phosphoribosyltransferase family protein [Bacteroidetes bacterium]|nr:phosphoribosyltransferase family protein [Bacteroidota bacterium]MCY4206096.1 phosphoribosyltransferase family protein [Bacteroidota bacterium]